MIDYTTCVTLEDVHLALFGVDRAVGGDLFWVPLIGWPIDDCIPAGDLT